MTGKNPEAKGRAIAPMQRLRRPHLVVAGVLVTTLAVTVALGALHVYRFYGSYRTQFVARALLSAQIFAESIARESGEARLQALTQTFVRGDVLYAQVVKGGQVVAEDRTEAARALELSGSDFQGRLVRRERRLEEDGTPYLEVLRPFTAMLPASGQGPLSYVRVGFSLREVRSTLKSEILITTGIGLGILLMVGLGGFAYLSLSRVEPGRRPPARDDAANGTGEGRGEQLIRAGPLVIDPASKEVRVGDRSVELSPKEYELMSLLASAPGRVFSNREILESVWSTGNAPTSKDVKQYIYLLRKKLERDADEPRMIVTVRGFGYKLDPNLAAEEGR